MIPGTDSGSPDSESDDLGVRKEAKNRNYLRVCTRSRGFPTSGIPLPAQQAAGHLIPGPPLHPPKKVKEKKSRFPTLVYRFNAIPSQQTSLGFFIELAG